MTNKLPFRIGMQYENWEFDLELVDTKKSYEVYNYTKGDIKVFNEELIEYIHLYFELDILLKIKIKTQQNIFTLL
ncbi:hypothetical protein ABHQ57_04905 [Tenacibaculum sp. ZH5_bin.1]|uniref:hypothetical protein n=1 Tax=unclassified Tenacibaculum TaxID=2635139 RepID=UPI0036F094DB